MSNLTYKISDDENTVVTLYNVYQFTESIKGCYRCELLSLCMKESKDEVNEFFPFPCMSDNRKDKRSGIFLTLESINTRKSVTMWIIALVFIILAVLVFYNIIPNYLGSWLKQ